MKANLRAFSVLLCCCAILTVFSFESRAQIVDGKLGWGGGDGTQADATNSNWYYNWWHVKPSGDATTNAEWIPLVKFLNNLGSKLATVTSYTDVDTILVLNEPERPEQSNTTVAEAIAAWPQFEATGMNLITPGISDNATGQAWLDDFMTQATANNYRMDGLAFHWYGASSPNNPAGAANNFLSRVDHYWNTYGLPIWITEFAIHDWEMDDTDQAIMDANEQFLDIVIPELESRSYVEAYAFYQHFTPPEQDDDARLLIDQGGLWTPTNVGDAYVPSYTTGESLDIDGTDQDNDTIYLRGGVLTNTGAAVNDAVRYIYAVDGSSQITGSGDLGTEAGGWIEINAGAVLDKTSGNTMELSGTTVNNRGDFHHSAGTMNMNAGSQINGTGTFHLEPGTHLTMGNAPDRDGATIGQSLELNGGSIQYNVITDGVHVLSGTSTVNATTTFSGAGSLEVIGPLAAPSGGGGGGIVKDGTGTLAVSANNTYEGNTVVQQGTLRIRTSGQLSGTPQIEVKPNGTLNVTSHSGGYDLVGQTLLLEGQVTGSINATNGSVVSAIDSASQISGDLTVDNSIVRVGGAGFNESIPGPGIVSTGLNLNYDAGNDAAGDSSWIDTESGEILTFSGSATPVAVADGSVPGISAVYDIPTVGGAEGLNAYFEGGAPRSLQDATFEVWFHVDSLGSSDDQVLFEAGGAGRGVALVLDGNQLRFNVNGDSSTSTVSATVGTGWHQAVGVIDLVGFNDNAANDSMSLYLNNSLSGSLNNLLIDDWAGGNLGGIGDVADSLGADGTPEAYHDGIAIVRYYQNHALDPNEIAQNYQAIVGSGITLPTTMQIGGDYLQQSDATLELDLLDTTTHDALDITGTATLAGTLDVDEVSGFAPSLGDSFEILSASGGVSGEFDSLDLPSLSGALWYVDYAATSVSLNVILGADFDGSGFVDGRDFLILQRNMGLTGQTDNSNGDADGNGIVDSFDLQIWEGQYGTNPASLISAITTVPEPSGIALVLGACMMVATGRPRGSIRR